MAISAYRYKQELLNEIEGLSLEKLKQILDKKMAANGKRS